MKQLKVNILGGRDVGKSTIAMHAVAELRWLGIPTALNCGISKFWGEGPAIVDIRVHDKNPNTWTPHALSELCEGKLNFLVLRRKDYVHPIGTHPDVARGWYEADDKLEETLREGRVRYKSLPGVRASVLYVAKKISDAVGYGK